MSRLREPHSASLANFWTYTNATGSENFARDQSAGFVYLRSAPCLCCDAKVSADCRSDTCVFRLVSPRQEPSAEILQSTKDKRECAAKAAGCDFARMLPAQQSDASPCTHQLSPCWVVCSSLGGQVVCYFLDHHSSVAASPLRQTGLSVGRSTSGRPPPGVLGWSFCPQAPAGHMVDCGECHCWGMGDWGLFSSVVLSQLLARSRGHTCRTLRGTGSVSTHLVRLVFDEHRDIGSGWGPTGSTSQGPSTPRLMRQSMCVAVLPSLCLGLWTVGAGALTVCCALIAGPPRELGMSLPHTAEHEGVMSSGMKKLGIPVFVYRPGPPAGRRKGDEKTS